MCMVDTVCPAVHSCRFVQIKMASSFPALLFSFFIVVCGWIVALAGVASLQSISPVRLLDRNAVMSHPTPDDRH